MQSNGARSFSTETYRASANNYMNKKPKKIPARSAHPTMMPRTQLPLDPTQPNLMTVERDPGLLRLYAVIAHQVPPVLGLLKARKGAANAEQ